MKLMKKNGGFTLVELIVVIAILAILAGIAVPAYSGYIKRAEKAGDLQLLGAINDAFAASCVASGGAVTNVTGATLQWNGQCVTGVATVSGTGIDADDCKANFQMLFAGNTATQFKAIEANSLVFDTAKSVFVDPTTVDSFTVGYKGNPITVPSSAVSAYKNSNWGNVASSDVLGLVGSVTDFAGAVDNATFLNMLGNEEYLNAAATALGVKPEDYDATVTGMLDAAEAKYREENPDATDDDIATYRDTLGGQIVANNAVLVAAKNANANKTGLIEMLTANDGKSAKSSIASAMGSSPADGLAQASMAYGLYTSYMLDKDPNYDTTTNPDPDDVMDILDDTGFQAYLKTDKATKDLDGFVSVLDAASKNTGNGVGSDIVQNGFADNEGLQDLMQQILGK